MRPLFIDGFAGGGGASTGIAQAIGRDVDIAINHSPSAIAIHKANHPGTEHHCQDIRAVWPRVATRNRHVAGAWFSPDCKEFSKAKGGSVKERHIRMLAMEIPHWLDETQPEVVYVENVEEFEDWGPLEQGEDGKWRVITALKGEDFKKWLRLCRRAGYRCDHRQLRACNYGAPTSRKRLYIIMRRDKKPIAWPKPTHGAPGSPGVRSGKLLPYRTAAECIDWSIPSPSIFGRKKDLAEATMRRIAHGVMRYVVNAAHPFIVGRAFTNTRASRVFDPQDPLRTATTQPEYGLVDAEIAPFVSYGQQGGLSRPATKPLHAVTASKKDTNGVVAAHLHKMAQNGVGKDPRAPLDTAMAGAAKHGVVGATLVRTGHGEVDASGKRRGKGCHDLGKPAPTVTASRDEAIATAFLSSFYTSDRAASGGDPEKPLRTVRAGGDRGGGHHAVVAAHMEQANTGMTGRPATVPLSTIVGKGCTQQIIATTMIEEGALPPEMLERAVKVAAFLVKYYATDGENETSQTQAVDRPIDVITGKARFAVVTVTVDAITYVIVDIGLRMLTPRELARAQGFPDDYVLDPECWYVTEKGNRKFGRLPIAMQISAIGNSVCPQVACALVRANQPGLIDWEDDRLAA